MNFEELCKDSKKTPVDPKVVVVEFLKYRSEIFSDILEAKDNIYKELLDFLLEKYEGSLISFIGWYRDYLYRY